MRHARLGRRLTPHHASLSLLVAYQGANGEVKQNGHFPPCPLHDLGEMRHTRAAQLKGRMTRCPRSLVWTTMIIVK